MPDLSTIGLAGLNSYQIAMRATATNTSNVDNPDFGRRIANFTTDPQGLNTVTITRAYDKYVTRDWYRMTSTYNLNTNYAGKIDNYQEVITNSGVDMTTGINNVFTALNGITANPTLRTNRQILLNSMNALTTQFQTVYDETQTQISSNAQELQSQVTEANNYLNSLAGINAQIVKPNSDQLGLADQRDALLRKLTGFMDIDATINSDQTASIRLNNGIPLLTGQKNMTLGTTPNPEQPTYLNITVADQGNTTDVTSAISGGSIGGAIAFRENIINPTLNGLGRLALTLQSQFNAQNKLGMDLNGDLGGNIFTDINDPTAQAARVQANVNNTGTATMGVNITDVNLLTTSDYRLSITATAPATTYALTRLSDNSSVASGPLGALPATINTSDGFGINVTASAVQAGDSFLITPTRQGMDQMNVAINSTDLLAMASPIATSKSTTNTGTGVISPGLATNTNPATSYFTPPGQFAPLLKIVFNTPTSYSILNATTSVVLQSGITFSPNQDNAIFPSPAPTSINPGISVSISGAPAAGDSFNINYNTNGTADARNATEMAKLQNAKVMSQSTQTLQDAYNQVLGDIASTGQAAHLATESSKTVLDQLQAQRDSISGVNLDEEAANLIEYQKVYQASAKILSMANDMFSALLNIMGG